MRQRGAAIVLSKFSKQSIIDHPERDVQHRVEGRSFGASSRRSLSYGGHSRLAQPFKKRRLPRRSDLRRRAFMYYVYILNSLKFPNKFYIGYTLNVETRLRSHNNGLSVYTKTYKPWKLFFSCCFFKKTTALEFEKYLKSHSGRAFIKKHLI